LIAALIVCIALALVIYFNRPQRSQASDTPAPHPVNETVAVPGAASLAEPVITQDPPIAVADAPATRPSDPQVPSRPSPPAAGFLATAATKRDAGELLAARNIVNDAVRSRSLNAADLAEARRFLGEINQQIFFSNRVFPDDPHCAVHVVQPGESLERIGKQYDIPWEMIQRINNIADPRRVRSGQKLKVPLGPIHAVVDKSDFILDVWLGKPYASGSMFLRSYRVGLGEANSTPDGRWLVTPGEKLRNPQWTNPRVPGEVIAGGDPKNPLGTRWIALRGIDGNAVGQQSYGIHGTIEPHTIGKMASMGCIRMLNEDVEVLYDLLRDGKSTVEIVE
jgi:hypothetical protein